VERLFGIADIVVSSTRSQEEFGAKLAGLAEWYPGSVDALLKMNYYRGKLSLPTTDRGRFEFFASTHYEQIPYTLWTVYDLTARGFYLEASILVRSLLEILIQLRYFDACPAALPSDISGIKSGSKRVQFKTMFDFFAPGFYKQYYGNIYSGIAHGKGWQMLFRFRLTDNQFSVVYGNSYDEEKATFVVNSVLPLILGFFVAFHQCFPSNILSTNAELEEEVGLISNFIKTHMEEHKKAKPDFYSQLVPVVLLKEI
jgi:hypothetical protein